jgi:Domain of unknown function (DUF4160)
VPTIIIIDGIRIEIFLNDHDPPHFHVRMGGMRAKFDIATGDMIKGRLDKRTIRKVQKWTEYNRDMLMQAWMEFRQR